MDPLSYEDLEPRRWPPRLWFAQVVGAFAAALVLGLAATAFAVSGGFAGFESAAAPAPVVATRQSDLRDGQFYQEQWVDPDIDAHTETYAQVSPAAYAGEAELEGGEPPSYMQNIRADEAAYTPPADPPETWASEAADPKLRGREPEFGGWDAT